MTLMCQLHAQKKIYIPEDLRKMNLQADSSQWSFKRSMETDDLILMWERGFGNDTANPPMLTPPCPSPMVGNRSHTCFAASCRRSRYWHPCTMGKSVCRWP